MRGVAASVRSVGYWEHRLGNRGAAVPAGLLSGVREAEERHVLHWAPLPLWGAGRGHLMERELGDTRGEGKPSPELVLTPDLKQFGSKVRSGSRAPEGAGAQG